MKDIQIIVANPAGNTTAFVVTPVEQKDYKLIGKAILDCKDLCVEQVGFIKNFDNIPRFEMCGLEFCGNAGRAFGLLCALKNNLEGSGVIEISESGCEHNLFVEIDTISRFANISMPLPKKIFLVENSGIAELNGATLVDLDGIMHVVLRDYSIRPSLELFAKIRDYVMKKFNPPAMGVMFINKDASIVPIVYVRDVDSTYKEGSCGSGTTACAIAWSQGCEEANRTFLVRQPAGEIIANVEITKGKVAKVTIGGPVEISLLKNISLDV